MNNLSAETALEGVWFSTTDLKLAVSLHVAGFPFVQNGECTRIVKDGKESFTWHFKGFNAEGQEISSFIKAWEQPASESLANPDPMIRFFVAREAMFSRTHVITESHLVPAHRLLPRGSKSLLFTPKLGRQEKERLSQIAS
jgi:hypothetical protein